MFTEALYARTDWSALPLFNPDAPCAWCGHDTLASAAAPAAAHHGAPVDHIVRTCQRCHWAWIEAPLPKVGSLWQRKATADGVPAKPVTVVSVDRRVVVEVTVTFNNGTYQWSAPYVVANFEHVAEP